MTFSEAPDHDRGPLPEDGGLVGRAHEVDALSELIASPGIVTVHGAAGVGKTAVALAAVRTSAVPLTPLDLTTVTDHTLVPREVSRAVEAPRRPGLPLADVLVEVIGGSRRILLLDTCEHLLPGVAALATTLTGRCPALTVLTTSRIPLGLPGETVHRLAPLAPPRMAALLAALGAPPAPATDLTRLGGLPLAAELERGADGRRGAVRAARHASIATAVEWSLRLCESRLRTLWTRLSVFDGPFGTGAATSVCGGTLGSRTPDALAALADAALLEPAGAGYVLLEPFRRHAAAMLDDLGETERLRERLPRDITI